jgi:c-di-GMP phosphodiesterase
VVGRRRADLSPDPGEAAADIRRPASSAPGGRSIHALMSSPALPAASAAPTLVARQPILDASGVVRAHELLFRGAGIDADGGGERATASVLVAAFLDAGLEEITGGLPAWVNVSRAFLLALEPLPLDPARVVIELLEDQVVDGALLDRLGRLRRDGFALALDDFSWSPDVDPLLDLATHVKLDVRALGLDGFAEEAGRLRGRDVVLLAEKVETAAEARAVVGMGATLLQGFHFARPEHLTAHAVPAGRLDAVQAVARLCRTTDFDEVEVALRTNPGLSLRVLRHLNSAALGRPTRVRSIRQALVLIGPCTVARWAATLLLADVAGERRAALGAGLLRARLGEQLAGARADVEPDEAFSAGLLSALDGLLDAPLELVLAGLPLDRSLVGALLGGEGPLGALLGDVLRIAEGAGARGAQEADALRDALVWADAVVAATRQPR